jgi:hypothetical protein
MIFLFAAARESSPPIGTRFFRCLLGVASPDAPLCFGAADPRSDRENRHPIEEISPSMAPFLKGLIY